MHSPLNNRDNPTQLLRHPILRSTLHEPFHSLQSSNFGPPSFRLVEDFLEDVHNLPRTLRSRGLHYRIDSSLGGSPDALGLVHQDIQKARNTREKESFGPFPQTLDEPLNEDPRRLPFGSLFTLAPHPDDFGNVGRFETFRVGLIRARFERLDEAVRKRFSREGRGGQGEGGELVGKRRSRDRAQGGFGDAGGGRSHV